MASFATITKPNENSNLYTQGTDWSDFPALQPIKFGGTAATIEPQIVIPDTGTYLKFNGQALAFASSVPALQDWALFPAVAQVDALTAGITTNSIDMNGGTITDLSALNTTNSSGVTVQSAVIGTNTKLTVVSGDLDVRPTALLNGVKVNVTAPSSGYVADIENSNTLITGPVTFGGGAGDSSTFLKAPNLNAGLNLLSTLTVTDADFTVANTQAGLGPFKKALINANTDIGTIVNAPNRPTFNAYVDAFNVGSLVSPALGMTVYSLGGVNINSALGCSLAGGGGVAISGGGGVTITGLGAVTVQSGGVFVQGGGVAVTAGGVAITAGGLAVNGGGIQVGAGGLSVTGGNVSFPFANVTMGTQSAGTPGVFRIFGSELILDNSLVPTQGKLRTNLIRSLNDVTDYIDIGTIETATFGTSLTPNTIKMGVGANTSTGVGPQRIISVGPPSTGLPNGQDAGYRGGCLILTDLVTLPAPNLVNDIQLTNTSGFGPSVKGRVKVDYPITVTPNVFEFSYLAYTRDGKPTYQVYVNESQLGPEITGSMLSPFITIQSAIDFVTANIPTGEVIIWVYPGTYTETLNITRTNTYICAIATGPDAQPTNLSSIVTSSVASGQVTFSGFTVSPGPGFFGALFTFGTFGTPSTASYTIKDCTCTQNGGPIAQTQGPVGSVNIDNCTMLGQVTATTEIMLNFVQTSGTINMNNTRVTQPAVSSATLMRCDTSLTMRNCYFLSLNTADTSPSALISFQNPSSPNRVVDIAYSEFIYTSTATDTGIDKSCLFFKNTGVQGYIATVKFCTLICAGGTRGSPQNQCISKTGAGSAAITFGALIADPSAHHISSAFAPKISYSAVV